MEESSNKSHNEPWNKGKLVGQKAPLYYFACGKLKLKREKLMAVESLDHYSVRTQHVERSVAFYEIALGLRRGRRPAFNFPGAWLYRSTQSGDTVGTSVVHIVGIDPNDPAGLSDYLGDQPLSPQAGTGSLDHIAFVASGIADMYARLQQQRIGFRQRKVPNLDLHQIFIADPDGVTIELNYSHPDDVLAGQQSLAAAT